MDYNWNAKPSAFVIHLRMCAQQHHMFLGCPLELTISAVFDFYDTELCAKKICHLIPQTLCSVEYNSSHGLAYSHGTMSDLWPCISPITHFFKVFECGVCHETIGSFVTFFMFPWSLFRNEVPVVNPTVLHKLMHGE